MMDLTEIKTLSLDLEHLYWTFKDLDEPNLYDESDTAVQYAEMYETLEEALGALQY